MPQKQFKTKYVHLNPCSDRDRDLVNFNLKCLEIAVQLLGPIKHDPKKPAGKIKLDRYVYVSALVEGLVTRASVLDDGRVSDNVSEETKNPPAS